MSLIIQQAISLVSNFILREVMNTLKSRVRSVQRAQHTTEPAAAQAYPDVKVRPFTKTRNTPYRSYQKASGFTPRLFSGLAAARVLPQKKPRTAASAHEKNPGIFFFKPNSAGQFSGCCLRVQAK